METDRLSPARPAARVRVFADARALVRGAAAEVLRRGRRALRERGAFDLALAGGSTPQALYQTLGRSRSARGALWRETHLFWGDERVVPPEDPASNFGAAWAVGLQRLAVPPSHVHRIAGESADPRRAAVLYESLLRARFAGATWPRFDLVILGVGEDGHTASLFPDSAALAERERWTAVAEGGTPPVPRVTLTLPVLNNAACALFLVTGAAKAAVLERLVSPLGERPLPAQRVRPARGDLLVFADRAAAGAEEPVG